MKILKPACAALIIFGLASQVYAWSGYDNESGSSVEIDKGNLVRPGETIDYYDTESGEYKTADVEAIQSYGVGTEVEIYDHDSGEYRTFSMDE